MRKSEEKGLERACCMAARTMGLAAVKLEKNGNKGIPDVLIIAPGGRALFVEFKRPDGRGVVSPEQRFWSEYLRKSHTFCSSEESFRKKIQAFFEYELVLMGVKF